MPATLHLRILVSTREVLMLARSTVAHAAVDGPSGTRRRSAAPRPAFVLIMLVVIGAVLLSPARASAATPDCDAVSFQQACRISKDFSLIDTGLCDAFPLEVTVSQVGMYRPVFAADGSGALTTATAEIRTLATILNPATGRFFTDRGANTERKTYLPDGSFEIRWTGTLHHIRMDTGERLLHQSGNYSVLLSPDDEFISDVSHGHFPSDATLGDEVCPLLAQPA